MNDTPENIKYYIIEEEEEPIMITNNINNIINNNPINNNPINNNPIISNNNINNPVNNNPAIINSIIHNTNIQQTNNNNNTINNINEKIPKLIFIIPYRDREQHLLFFKRQMKHVLEDLDENEYKIYYVHQCDNRSFNRGALKNIGFLAMRLKYPQHYKSITFVFNDVDTMPFNKNFIDYETTFGIVKHFYGFTFTLGGIVSITGVDFERIHGFPNFWAWGFEDNMLNDRVKRANLTIDRDHFFPYADKNILHLHDGYTKPVNRSEFDRYARKTTEGWSSIKDLKYSINEDTGFIDVTYFSTGIIENVNNASTHDLRNGPSPFKGARGMGMRGLNMMQLRK